VTGPCAVKSGSRPWWPLMFRAFSCYLSYFFHSAVNNTFVAMPLFVKKMKASSSFVIPTFTSFRIQLIESIADMLSIVLLCCYMPLLSDQSSTDLLLRAFFKLCFNSFC
jgi:hypothetical protein